MSATKCPVQPLQRLSLTASALGCVTLAACSATPTALPTLSDAPSTTATSSTQLTPRATDMAPLSSGDPTLETETPALENSSPDELALDQASPDQPALATIRQLLAEIPQKGRAPKTGYNREEFGQRWSDDVSVEFGHNGCDTRNDILRRDLINKEIKPNTHDCVVMRGQLRDPYTAQTIEFARGRDTSSAVQIDHVVALSDSWQKGAQQLAAEQRRNLANDPLNLLAVDGPANIQKSDGDAATWLPANSAFRCHYVARQTVVKHRYQLWMTPAEHEAIQHWLSSCTPSDEEGLQSLVDPQ